MGVTVALTLIWQSPACRSQSTDVVVPLVLWGTFAGGLGSLVRPTRFALHVQLMTLLSHCQLDSLLGATLQCTRYLNTTKRIVTDEGGAPAPGADVKVISGLDLLTNNQVSRCLLTRTGPAMNDHDTCRSILYHLSSLLCS